ncbi:MAG: response regulator transcription factor [Acidimicrobiales bacterium]
MRVLVVEDSVLLRAGLGRLLEDEQMELVGEAGDAESFLAIWEETRPDISIVDVRMPPTHTDEGIRASVELRKRHPDARILVLSQYVEVQYANELLADGSGGIGYLLKERIADVAEFVDAVERVAGGGTALDPEVVNQLFSRRQNPLDRLTPRESEVLSLMAQGFTNAAIADQLDVGAGAIEKHTSSIFSKLNLEPRSTDHRRVLAVLTWLDS